MSIIRDLNCPLDNAGLCPSALARVFDWYLSLKIPYETLSNIALDALVKSPDEMASCVRNGSGGHCVEHSILLTELLNELGYSAELLNADYHDYLSGKVILNSKPLVAVKLDSQLFACDPFYRRIMLEVPSNGSLDQGQYTVHRYSKERFSLTRRKSDVVVDEDRADFNLTLENRRGQFERRYAKFTPFGITAPFFQVMHPERKAVFYSPREDSILYVEGSSFVCLGNEEVDRLDWVPERIIGEIKRVLPLIRTQRSLSLEFLESGLFPPYYEGMVRKVQS